MNTLALITASLWLRLILFGQLDNSLARRVLNHYFPLHTSCLDHVRYGIETSHPRAQSSSETTRTRFRTTARLPGEERTFTGSPSRESAIPPVRGLFDRRPPTRGTRRSTSVVVHPTAACFTRCWISAFDSSEKQTSSATDTGRHRTFESTEECPAREKLRELQLD